MKIYPAIDKFSITPCRSIYEKSSPPLHLSTSPELLSAELLSAELAPPARKRIVRHSCRQNFPSVQRC
jgi:hypothetical protein